MRLVQEFGEAQEAHAAAFVAAAVLEILFTADDLG